MRPEFFGTHMWDFEESEQINFFARKGKGDIDEKSIDSFFSGFNDKYTG